MTPSFHLTLSISVTRSKAFTFRAITARNVLISAMARLCPRQNRCPAPNGIHSVVGRVSSFSHRSGLNPALISMCDPSSTRVLGSASCVRPTLYIAHHPLGTWTPSTTRVSSTVRTPPPEMGQILIVSRTTASRYGHSSSIWALVKFGPRLATRSSCSFTSLSHASGCRPRSSMASVRVLDDVSEPAMRSKNVLSMTCFFDSFADESSSSVAHNMALMVEPSGPSDLSSSILSMIFSSRYCFARYVFVDLRRKAGQGKRKRR
mmetsp:Transcript_36362/g.67174  ORF Transcript_36362/g.67174 Transcript_36362/m.67174 type:complete len:262 (-) Transcript_36362:332-1117(-)